MDPITNKLVTNFMNGDRDSFEKILHVYEDQNSLKNRELLDKLKSKSSYIQLKLGISFHEAKDYKKALFFYKESAKQSNPYAEMALGIMYENGQGMDKNYAEALKYYKLSSEKKLPYALFLLGNMYVEGFGVRKDYNEAAKYLKQSAEKGHSGARELLDNINKK